MARIQKLTRAHAAIFAIAAICVFALLSKASRAQENSASPSTGQTPIIGWPTHAHDEQHTGISAVVAQTLASIHWSTPVDLDPPLEGEEILIHYGSPLVTPANTVIIPVKTAGNAFSIDARNGSDGSLLWTLATGYQAPFAEFMPGMGSTLSGNKLFIPGPGGTVLVRSNPDSATGSLSHLVFYGAKNLAADRSAYLTNVQINTPITADANGNIFFGFIVLGSTPIGLQSGLARIAANGQGTWISAASASGDPNITKVDMSCAPALSLDGSTVYVGVNNFDFGFGYLLALNSTTLQPLHSVLLVDPWSGLDATISDDSSGTPTVGPDGDVYFGVLESPFPSHNDRGWLLHFSSDLTQVKIPGSFGWDDTAAVVDASLVPSYHGTSTYLLMTKYNNYADVGTGDGVNKLAILDPSATEPDPVIPSTSVMKEVLTIKGVTRDPDFPNLPHAVREWCINSAAVDPITKSILANSEDGKLYRWDLVTNTFSQRITLTSGIGEAYTPTLIGSDGSGFAINDAILFSIGK